MRDKREEIYRQNFMQLVTAAMKDPSLSNMRPVIEKEILHYDLIAALDRERLLDGLVFQGGTAIRLCYGGKRFSEDLDFAGGADFTSHKLMTMKECIEHYLTARYGLEVTVKEPNSLKKDPQYAELKIDKWQIAIQTSPDRPDLKKQKIKLEVGNIPAHTATPQSLNRNYNDLPDGYDDIIVMTEDKSEIMADKLVALPACTKYVRHRDIWDLAYLSQEKAKVRPDLVGAKVDEYKIDNYDQLLDSMINRLPDIIASKGFQDEMRRFLPSDVFDRTLGQDKFSAYLQDRVSGLLIETQDALNPTDDDAPTFTM